MNIYDLIRAGAIASTQDTELIQNAVGALGNAVHGVPDNKFGSYLALTKNGDNFLAGGWGTMEDMCLNLIMNYSKKASESCPAGSETVMLPYMDMLWYNIAQQNPMFIKCLAKQAVQRCNCDANWNITDEKVNSLEDLRTNPLCTFEFLNRAVGVLVKRTENADGTVNRKLTLCTRSIEILNNLYQYKMLVLGKGQSIIDTHNKLWGAKNNSDALVKDGKAFVVQLTCNRVVSNADGSRRPIFEMKFTQGRVGMALNTETNEKTGVKTTTYFYPLSMMYAEEKYLKKKLNDSVYRVVKETDFGDKERLITSNKAALATMYKNAGVTDELANAKITKLWGNMGDFDNRPVTYAGIVGFDIVNMHYYFPDVEASVYEPTVFGIRPGAVKYLTKVATNTVNTSMYMINPYIINQIFNTRVNRAVLSDYDCLPEELCLGALKYRNQKRDQLLAYGAGLNDKELYMFVSNPQHAKFFGDIPRQIAHRTRVMARYLKYLKPIDVASYGSLDKMREDVNKMLNDGVLRMTILSNKHEVMEVMATNNREILERTYGKNNIENYESLRSRLKMAAVEIKELGDTKKIPEILDNYGLTERCEELMEKAGSAPASVFASELLNMAAELASKDHKYDENTIFYRIADGYKIMTSTGQIAIIRQCNLSNIIKLSYSPYTKVIESEAD